MDVSLGYVLELTSINTISDFKVDQLATLYIYFDYF